MIRVGIIGATGFTGHELIKILNRHPQVTLEIITTTAHAGKSISDLYPDLLGVDLTLELYSVDEMVRRKVDLVFLAVHHGAAMDFVPDLLNNGIKVVDLSADFRFEDPTVYAKAYDTHRYPELCKQAVYGLPEWFRRSIRKANLIGNPGCYVTASLLPLIPLKDVISEVLIDAKSGVSGAGKKLDDAFLSTQVMNNFKAYAIARHRHQPEIETYAGLPIEFVPHLLPISRGILATLYFKSDESLKVLRARLVKAYADEPFVHVIDRDPEIRMVSGTNHCCMNIYPASHEGRFMIVSVIDNLLKGASGQAVQNMNLMLGFPEEMGLDLVSVYP